MCCIALLCYITLCYILLLSRVIFILCSFVRVCQSLSYWSILESYNCTITVSTLLSPSVSETLVKAAWVSTFIMRELYMALLSRVGHLKCASWSHTIFPLILAFWPHKNWQKSLQKNVLASGPQNRISNTGFEKQNGCQMLLPAWGCLLGRAPKANLPAVLIGQCLERPAMFLLHLNGSYKTL